MRCCAARNAAASWYGRRSRACERRRDTVSRRLTVEADGGSRGNPGPAGYGAVVREGTTGEVLGEIAEGIGTATNNVAEYRGLIAGLRTAAQLDRTAEVEIRMDSKLVVEQMTGRWRIRNPDLLPLAAQARELAEGFAAVAYAWVPRERNAHADRLANEAMDAAAWGRPWVRTAAAQVPEPEPEHHPTGTLPGWVPRQLASPTTTVLVRHGETELSLEKRFAGVGDIGLTETGAAQAQALAERFYAGGGSVDAIVTSSLRRARETAQAISAALELSVLVDDGFRETDFGDWEGLTFADVEAGWPDELAAWLADPTVAPPRGESFAETEERVRQSLDKVVARFPGRTVLVVTHVTPVKTLVRLALQAPHVALYRMHLDVGCVSEVDWYDDGAAVVRLLNDTSHLRT
ncbi:MAG: bifunctional RNase H/acid phosphatase [Streptosporangiales bacterium]|nr:bifunctional RNase H/acid phosphatase [Streptosporangiales bacterium]